MELDLGDLLSTSLLEYCGCDTEEDERTIDSFLIAALESYEREYANDPAQPIQQPHPQSTLTSPTLNSTFRPFAAPVSDEDIVKARVESVPKKTREDTKYCVNLWEEWRNYRLQHTTATIPLLLEMTNGDLQYWMTRFIMEVRKKDGSSFPPNTLHHICCGIMRHLRTNGKPSLDFFKDPEFADFRASIDAEMKRLQAAGLGSKRKQAEPLTREEVEILWEKGLLGDANPQSLVDTMLFMNGLFFALRSGHEHRQLRFDPPQIQLFERPG